MARNANRLMLNVSALLLGLGGLSPPTFAQTPTDQWQFEAIVYGYLPQLTGTATLPTGKMANINVDPHELISGLNFCIHGRSRGA